MAVFVKPAAAGQEFEEYLVIGHMDNLSIVQSPEGKKYYARLDRNQQPAGTVIDRSLIRPVEELSVALQYRIQNEF